jgi:hypothetical protein
LAKGIVDTIGQQAVVVISVLVGRVEAILSGEVVH